MSNIHQIIRSDLLNFSAYRATANRASLGDIWLNSNELPYDLGYELNDLKLNRYPARAPAQLLQQLAEYYQLSEEQILLGRGSDEAIDLLIRLCCQAGKDSILICPPTFHMYQIYASLQGAKVVSIPTQANNNFELPFNEIISQWKPDIKLIFLCSPNNPTGNIYDQNSIIELCSFVAGKALVIVDEAYHEFTTIPSLTTQLASCSNLVVLRTLSKAFGLAGARCGVALAQTEIIEWLRKIASPYPLPSPTILAAQNALAVNSRARLQEYIQEIRITRDKMSVLLLESPLIEQVWPSDANFLLVKTSNAPQFISRCFDQGIIVRNYHEEPGLENCIRITIGKKTEMETLLQAIGCCFR